MLSGILIELRTEAGLNTPEWPPPRPGLEPGTISLHMIHNFRYGVDYLISHPPTGGGIRVYSLYTFIRFYRNLARDCHPPTGGKGFPELARFFNSYFYEKLPYLTGSRSTIELPRNKFLTCIILPKKKGLFNSFIWS